MKKFFLFFSLILLFFAPSAFSAGCTGSSGSYVCTDDFNRGDNATLGTDWTKNTSGNEFAILTNQANITSGGDVLEHWNTVTFQNAQYSQAVLIAFNGASNDTGIGLGLRCSGTLNVHTGYRIVVNAAGSNNVTITRLNAGTGTLLKQVTNAFSVNDVLRVEIDNNYVITVKQNGSTVTTYDDSASGSKIASGYPGMAYSSSNTGKKLDDWGGGDLTAGGGGASNTVPCLVVICGDDDL